MHKYEKINLMECVNVKSLPPVRHTLSTLDCPNCHWRQPIPVEYTDWRAIAEAYEKAYNKMATSFFKKLEEAGETFDVPLVEYFDADRQIMLAQLREIIRELRNDQET